MKKVEPVPFHTLYEKNDNMYQNVIIVSKRARGIISENVLDLKQIEEGFESSEEMHERNIENPNKPKAIVTAANEFVSEDFELRNNSED